MYGEQSFQWTCRKSSSVPPVVCCWSLKDLVASHIPGYQLVEPPDLLKLTPAPGWNSCPWNCLRLSHTGLQWRMLTSRRSKSIVSSEVSKVQRMSLGYKLYIRSPRGAQKQRTSETRIQLKSKYSLWENTDFVCVFVQRSIKKIQKNTNNAKRHDGIERQADWAALCVIVSLWTEWRVGEVRLKVFGSGRVFRVQVGLKHPLQQSVHGSITWRPQGGERTETPGRITCCCCCCCSCYCCCCSFKWGSSRYRIE